MRFSGGGREDHEQVSYEDAKATVRAEQVKSHCPYSPSPPLTHRTRLWTAARAALDSVLCFIMKLSSVFKEEITQLAAHSCHVHSLMNILSHVCVMTPQPSTWRGSSTAEDFYVLLPGWVLSAQG